MALDTRYRQRADSRGNLLDLDEQLDRPSRHEALPAPPRTPSIGAERLRAWGPILAGLAALVTAGSTLAASAGGWFRQDLTPMLDRLARIEAAVQRIEERGSRTQEQIDRHERAEEATKSNERATADLIRAMQKELRERE